MNFLGMDWAKLLDIVNLLAGPLLTAGAVAASVLFFRAEPKLHTALLLTGCALIFLQRVAHAIMLLPGLGYFDRLHHPHAAQIVAFNNVTCLMNLIAWLVFVPGLFTMAWVRFRASREAVPCPAGTALR